MGTIETADCATCNGIGHVAHESYGQTYECSYCDGSGVRKRAGHGGYKTAANAARALASGKGVKCQCDNGRRPYPATVNCWKCTDGRVVTKAVPGDTWADLPRGLRFKMGGDAMADYVDALEYVVDVQNRQGTWNEAYLGLGSIVSCTDYGRNWGALTTGDDASRAAALAALVDHVRTKDARSTQWVNFTNESGELASVVTIQVHRNGYVVMAAARRAAALPPAYTDELLNSPA